MSKGLDAILIATGSEVSLAVEAAARLSGEGRGIGGFDALCRGV